MSCNMPCDHFIKLFEELLLITMFTKLSLCTLPLLIVSTSCQFAVDMMKPDISFGDDNDRYDLSSMIRKQNRMFRERTGNDFRRQRSRRHSDEDIEEKLKTLEKAFNTITSSLAAAGGRRIGADENDAQFAYHDEMYSKEGGGVTDFENNLKQFKRSRPNDENYRRAQKYIDRLHGGLSRKASDPEREILLHYAVPIDLKVKGYLQAPL